MTAMRKMLSIAICALLAIALASAAISCSKKKTVTKKSSTPSTGPTTLQPAQNSTGLPLTVPAGFSISYFAKDVPGPRAFTFDSAGTLLVSSPSSGSVFALPDRDKNGKADSAVTVVSGLNAPHGLAFLPSDPTKFYVAETDAVAIYDYNQTTMQAANRRKIIDLASGGGHSTRTIIFAPAPNEGRLLISVGSSCNACVETNPQRAKILIANADGSGLRTFASGLRNSVFTTVHPASGKVWATENGRDLLGDDIPPDEVNIIEDGRNYGWPYYYGKNILDTDFVTDPSTAPAASEMTPSHVDLQAHSAALGLVFVNSEKWPAEYRDDLIVAFHGSWNRSVPTGDKLVRVRLDASGNPAGVDDFITGWQSAGGSRLGRPAGVIVSSDGVMYVSDDSADTIYRITPR